MSPWPEVVFLYRVRYNGWNCSILIRYPSVLPRLLSVIANPCSDTIAWDGTAGSNRYVIGRRKRPMWNRSSWYLLKRWINFSLWHRLRVITIWPGSITIMRILCINSVKVGMRSDGSQKTNFYSWRSIGWTNRPTWWMLPLKWTTAVRLCVCIWVWIKMLFWKSG